MTQQARWFQKQHAALRAHSVNPQSALWVMAAVYCKFQELDSTFIFSFHSFIFHQNETVQF